jgi:hypothetical protein
MFMKHFNAKRTSLLFSALVLGAGSMSDVMAQPDVPNPSLICQVTAQSVVSFQPAKRKDGSVIPAEFVNASNVLGVPQNSDAQGAVNYTSLGFGGEITVMLSDRLANGTGADFRLVETTYSTSPCGRYPEKAEVFVSQDGCNFVCLGSTCQDGNFDIDGTGFEWIRYVKIHDISPITNTFQNDLVANGYDLDGIQCLNGAADASLPFNTTFMAGAARTYQNYLPANPSSIPSIRRNPALATGFPQNNNGTPVTFTSLGFGGEITLVFDYIVFDKQGADLFVTETSGSANYPEKAEFYGSACGSEWVLLGTTEDGTTLEQDGWIDLNGALYGLKYLRIIDRSRKSQFSAGSDGYDVDGVTVINGTNCTSNGAPTSTARYYQTETNVADESGVASVYPNPFNNVFTFSFMGGSKDEQIQLNVFNITGQTVYTQSMEVTAGNEVAKSIDLSLLPAGVYFFEHSSVNGKETIKLVKN